MIMKTIYRFIIATFAAAVALASCSKEMIKPDAEAESGCENDSVRVITVSYVATKATFYPAYPDNLTPTFSDNDVIKVSNGSKIEDCTVTRKNSVYQISTKLPGRLTAVFPASAAIISGTEITGVDTSVKDNQGDGHSNYVMDYISAIATIEPVATSATFEIQQAIFKINYNYGLQGLFVSSLKTIEGGFRTGEKVPIATTESRDPSYDIELHPGRSDYCFVVIQPGVNLSDLSFDIKSDYNGHKMKGIPLSVIGERDNQTVANGFYTIDDQNWHDYVIYKNLKYAKMNIGATEKTGPDSYGEYFMWGDVHGYKPSGSGFAFPSANPDPGYRFPGVTWDSTQGFARCNEPFYIDSPSKDYEKYNSSGKLELKDDAAYANWGGAWRMPTDDELGYLARSSSTEKGWDDTSKCFLFNKSDNNNILYFPAAGTGSGLDEPAVDSKGSYWSSDLSSTWPSSGKRLKFESNGVVNNTELLSRYSGSPIRPVADL